MVPNNSDDWYIFVYENGTYLVLCAACASNIKGTRKLTNNELAVLCGMSSAECDDCGKVE